MKRIGILGGTLDPIHCGHLSAAVAARDAFGLSDVLVVPSHIPPHRPIQPLASPYHRFAMTSLAIVGVPRLQASDEELCAAGPSYTAETLDRLHARGIAAPQIFFITGADAFADIATWKRYPSVLDQANFVVVARPGHRLDALASRLPALADRMRQADERAVPRDATSIFLLDTPTPDVSSTIVRERLKQGAPVDGLVPPLVEAHIRQHALYSVPLSLTPRIATPADQLHGQDREN